MTARLMRTAPAYRPRAEQDPEGRDQPRRPDGAARTCDYIPGWDCHGLPIEWKVEEEYRASGPRTRTRCRCWNSATSAGAYAAHWLDVQREEFKRLGVTGDWEERYATMDLRAEAAIADEIGKFLLNGSLYRGLRPVMWSPVEKTALAEAEIEYHDHVSRHVWVRFPVVTAPDARPGRRLRGDLDHDALDHAGQPRRSPRAGDRLRAGACGRRGRGPLAGPARRCWSRCRCCRRSAKEAGIGAHHLKHVLKGAELAGTVSAHPLRGAGLRVRRAAAAGRARHDRGRHRLRPYRALAMARRTSYSAAVRPGGAGDGGRDGTYTPWVPLFAGAARVQGATPVYARCRAAGDAAGARRS